MKSPSPLSPRARTITHTCLALGLVLGCASSVQDPDAAANGGSTAEPASRCRPEPVPHADAGATDAGSSDASPRADAGGADASTADASSADAGSADASSADASSADAGSADASSADAAPSASDDPFDSNSCTGATLERTEAIARIGAGNSQRSLGDTVPLRVRTRSCNAVTGCGAWSASAQFAPLTYMAPAGAGDNGNYPLPFNVTFWVYVPYMTTGIQFAVEEVSARTRIDGTYCAGCSPSGAKFPLGTSSVADQSLYINYPRWDHTSSGFQRQYDWAERKVGDTTLTVTDHCARFSALSADKQTELAALFRY